ncbi:hypothetical protein [Novosphingobium panipatense]|uniref:hypothetical protein n=1 Tax=Novosphingobium panipatense TaxID=428991 RepID=UPI0036094442
MATDALIAASALAAVLGVGTLRFAWSRAKRSSVLNTLGWGLLAASVAGGWAGAGAWGSTVSALWAMGAAFVLLAVAALTAPAARSPASNRRAGMLPEGNEPRRTGRRLITFCWSPSCRSSLLSERRWHWCSSEKPWAGAPPTRWSRR